MYHRIAEEAFDPWGLAVSPTRFSDQMQWAGRTREILSLAEFADRHRRGSLPPEALAVTFDDGYACATTTAAPVLQLLGIHATVFIAPDLVGGHREFWWDELQRMVIECDGATLEVEGKTVELGVRHDDDGTWLPARPAATDRQRAFKHIWAKLSVLPPERIERVMTNLRDQAKLDPEPRETHRLMTAEEMRELDAATISFGSHSLAHASLPSLPSREKVRHILQSLERCEAITGRRPLSFAYPFGQHDDEAEALVEHAGFECACTTEQAAVGLVSEGFALPRLHVGNWSAAQLKRALRLL